jgi:lysophospholipase L1-like esterase
VFAPAFHQALRWSVDVPEATTFRMKLPVSLAGGRLRVVFRAGDGPLTLLHASVAPALVDGAPSGEPLPLTFAGLPGATGPARALIESDPLPLAVAFNEELEITFSATGSLAQSAINAFPSSLTAPGDQVSAPTLAGATAYPLATGIATVEVEAVPGPVFVAVGDSITEGYTSGNDDYRKGWTHVLETALHLPVVNAGVSGTGLVDELTYLDGEVLSLDHVTDCVVLIATNDLALPATRIETLYGQLIARLQPFCRVWAGALLPKERHDVPETRHAVNAWLRTQAPVAGVIDFEAAMEAAPDDPDHFAPGLDEDGIHPTAKGYAVMGQAAFDYLTAHALSPERSLAPLATSSRSLARHDGEAPR